MGNAGPHVIGPDEVINKVLLTLGLTVKSWAHRAHARTHAHILSTRRTRLQTRTPALSQMRILQYSSRGIILPSAVDLNCAENQTGGAQYRTHGLVNLTDWQEVGGSANTR